MVGTKKENPDSIRSNYFLKSATFTFTLPTEKYFLKISWQARLTFLKIRSQIFPVFLFPGN